MAIMERGGRIKALSLQKIGGKNLKNAIRENLCKTARIMNEQYAAYTGMGDHFDGGNGVIKRSAKEYARGRPPRQLVSVVLRPSQESSASTWAGTATSSSSDGTTAR